MASFAPVDEQLRIIARGAADLVSKDELAERLAASAASGRPLRVKCGFDPTRPDLHLGHAVVLQKMREMQDLGHTIVLLVGEFTAMVGDPTGANDLRPRLSREEVQASAETYKDQAFKVLDRAKTEVRTNAEWLDALKPSELVELMAKMTVSRMLERNDFGERFQAEKPIYQHEFLYPLLQGYDSVALEADLEMGGTDQLFNLLVGRDLMPKYGQRGQMVLTMPILEGTDARVEGGRVVGAKMSKSKDNYIGLQEPPAVMWRKAMQIDDEVVFRYFELVCRKTEPELAALRAEKAAGKNPQEIKALFAREIVTRFHDAAAADGAEAEFKRVYGKSGVPDDVPEVEIPADGDAVWIAKALKIAGLVASTSDGRRLVEQGGVELDQARVTDAKLVLAKGARHLARVGSKNRRFAWLKVV